MSKAENNQNKIIGDKEILAFEYFIEKREPYIMGRFKLWLNNCYIGSYESNQMILSIFSQLNRLRNLNNLLPETLKKEEAYNYITTNNGNYLLSLGEGFDDFIIYVYYLDGDFYFIWELLFSPFFICPNYPKGIQSAKVSKDFLFEILLEIKKEL